MGVRWVLPFLLLLLFTSYLHYLQKEVHHQILYCIRQAQKSILRRPNNNNNNASKNSFELDKNKCDHPVLALLFYCKSPSKEKRREMSKNVQIKKMSKNVTIISFFLDS
jgi:hypothetical protein